MLIASFYHYHFGLMPAFDMLGLGDPLRSYRFWMMQDFVLHFVFIQTIDQLSCYFHRHLRWKVSLSRAISTIRKRRYSVSSRPRIAVTTKPSRLTANTIARTLGTPNFCFTIGSRNTPIVAPSFATPA